jgi:hypothetical protein
LALATTTDHVGDQDENDELKETTLKDKNDVIIYKTTL